MRQPRKRKGAPGRNGPFSEDIALTSVDQPGADMGRSAVDRLSERIGGERTAPRHDVVAPSLVVRSTTGPPRDNRKDFLDSVKPIHSSHHLSNNE